MAASPAFLAPGQRYTQPGVTAWQLEGLRLTYGARFFVKF